MISEEASCFPRYMTVDNFGLLESTSCCVPAKDPDAKNVDGEYLIYLNQTFSYFVLFQL